MGREKVRQRLAIKKAFSTKKKFIPTHKQHRFESFSQRVSRLKIDPIRRDRGRHDERDLTGLQSHFRDRLDKWMDENLSDDFSKFARQVDSLCDSLPQVIHHQERIVDLLLENVEKATAVSAEPFLDLIAHVAQDLQTQFEHHFERTVKTVAAVAASNPAVEVVEWSFNCLTWLFKYLERILAADIRPLYDLLAPYLGKERQKPFVSRFAAESLSFLVRKVAKRETAIHEFTQHAIHDLVQTSQEKDTELYEHSLIKLFVEAIKITQTSLHSTGVNTFSALISSVRTLSIDAGPSAPRVVRGVFLQLIQQCPAEVVSPLLESVLAISDKQDLSPEYEREVTLSAQLTLLAVSLAGGVKVQAWALVLKYLAFHIEVLTAADPTRHSSVAKELLVAFAVAHSNCPLDVALSSVSVLDSLCSTKWQAFFPGFCNVYADHGVEYGIDRFRSFLLPHFQRFLTTLWDGQTVPLAILSSKLARNGIFPPSFKLPSKFESEIISKISTCSKGSKGSSVDDAASLDTFLDVLECSSHDEKTFNILYEILASSVERFLQLDDSPLKLFFLGHGFLFLADKNGRDKIRMIKSLAASLSSTLSDHLDFPIFIRAAAKFLATNADLLATENFTELEQFRHSLLQCVSSSSREIRLAALQMLEKLIASEHQSYLALAVDVESTEPTLETSRLMGMQIKNLGMHYKTYSSCPILREAIPRWMFGLLHLKYAEIWKDACEALKQISQVKESEEIICDIAFKWVENAPTRSAVKDVSAKETSELPPEDYFTKTWTKVMKCIGLAEQANNLAIEAYAHRHERIQSLTCSNRTQALMVLKTLPQLAEKKSRSLVPVLISWSAGMQDSDLDNVDVSDVVEVQVSGSRALQWPRRDQKALLGLFAAFGNPKVLYRSDEVYNSLLSLLEHGDPEIQKAALQAVLAWRDKTLRKYSDELYKFLDDERLREQLSVWLDEQSVGENPLRVEDRPVVMPIVLRLIYGRITARSRNERGSSRRSFFFLMSNFSQGEVNCFLDVVLGPYQDANYHGTVLPKRQLGMLNMIKDLLETWKSTSSPYIARLAPPIFHCLLLAAKDTCASLETSKKVSGGLSVSIQSLALQCLNLCFQADSDFNWDTYMPKLFEYIIRPRLPKFAQENAQNVSTRLRTFAIWAQSPRLSHHLCDQEDTLLPKVIECLGLSFTKDVVKRFIISDILRPFISLASMDETASVNVKRVSRDILDNLASLLAAVQLRELLEDGVSLATELMAYTSECSPALLSISAKLVQQSSKKTPHASKTKLLAMISHFYHSLGESPIVREEVYNAVCASFAYFADATSRTLLVGIAQKFVELDEELAQVIMLLEDLNAFVANRLGLPDFDRRSKAFSEISSTQWSIFSSSQWRLLLGNLMFYVKDNEELAIRASASHCLKRFVDAAALKNKEEQADLQDMLQHIVLAGIEKGLKDQPYLVQVEYLSILGQVAESHKDWSPVSDLHHLLMNDEESSFFINILHIQQHRRIRALQRLADVVSDGKISARNLYHLILTLLENFVFRSEDGVLAAESMKTIAVVVEWLDWQQCRSLFKRYAGYMKSKEDAQETVLKLLDAVTGAICRSAKSKMRTVETISGDSDEVQDLAAIPSDHTPRARLTNTMPSAEKLSLYIMEEILPPFSAFLKNKDESFVSRRLSVALITAKFVQLLPQQDFSIRFPPLLTDVCNILRSKDQGSRDSTRKVLSSMCALIGASAVGFILRELRTTLQRGFALHVLSYSVHSLIESTISKFQPGDLDYCAEIIIDVVIEDIFGNTGKEKEIKEYLADRNTKKEVKSKKSLDTMQLMASITSLSHLIELVRPIQALLAGHTSTRDVRQIDELLRRIELGVLLNTNLKNKDVLIFCYQIIQEVQQTTLAPAKARKSNGGLVESEFLIRAVKKDQKTSLHSSEANGKIIRFALEIVRSVLKKNKDLQTESNVAGWMPILGDALLNPNEEVKLSAIRLFTGIVNVPLKRIDADAPVYIAEAARIVEDSQGHGGELEQASLKLISAVLRERKSAPVKIKETTISLLLQKMRPDLQVISQQGVSFNLLKAVIGRGIVVPELYAIMDGEEGVAAMSVRDHDRTTRHLARGVYFQFLMTCPQGEHRFNKQLSFLERNLSYEYAEGRKSVMDTIHLLITKVGDALVADVIKALFWPLVSSLVNDEDAECRELVASLIKEIFERADENWTEKTLDVLQKMLTAGKPVHQRTALQCWALHLEVEGYAAQGTDLIIEKLKAVLAPRDFDADQWQLTYWAIHTLAIIARERPNDAFGKQSVQIWTDVRRYLAFPHLWVKQEAASLVSLLIKQIVSSNKITNILPLAASASVRLDALMMCELTYKHFQLLRDGVTQDLASQAVRNLAFFGKVFAQTGIDWQSKRPNGSIDVEAADDESDVEFQGFSSDENNATTEEQVDVPEQQTALAYFLGKLTTILRREPTKATFTGPRQAEALIPKTASLALLTALGSTLPPPTLASQLTTLLKPLVHLTSPTLTIPLFSTADYKSTHEQLVNNATELMDTLRETAGTADFVDALSKVKAEMRVKTEERRVKRRIDVVMRPDVVARKRVRRGEKDKERRREKNAEERGKRRGW